MSADLPNIEGLDIGRAMDETASSYEDYIDILKTYYRTIEKKADEITETYLANDIGNYTILVHALKSASRAIGAYELGEMAYELELCGKSGDTGTIAQKTPLLIEECYKLKENISVMFPKNEENVSIGLEDLIYILEDIKSFMEDNDLLLVNDTLEQLEGVYYNDDARILIENINELALEMEYGRAISLIDDFLDKIS